ncbi:MAG: AMP-binding protein, partial [Acidobacteriota bacterium]
MNETEHELQPDPTAGWNFADITERIARFDRAAPAQVYVVPGRETKRFTWGDFDRRTTGIASRLVAAGVSRQGKLAQYLYNRPEYMESVFGAFKASMVPVNTNYRYTAGELEYLWQNADAEAVVFQGCFSSTIEGLRERLPLVRLWLWVDDGDGDCPDWAEPYEAAAESGTAAELPWRRRGDDLWLLYTGGTTGMPKGVMWQQDDLWQLLNEARLETYDLSGGLDGMECQFPTHLLRPTQLPACPLMHGTGFITALGALLGGGCVVTLGTPKFEPRFVLDVIEQEKVSSIAIVGDAFAKPLLRELDAHPGHWDLSSLLAMVSSGVMWSHEVKRGLLAHHGELLLSDGLGSSESIGMARSESTGDHAETTAQFELGDHACVLDEDGKQVEPGSDVKGRIAVSGWIPVGYYKDEVKTAETFPVYDGVRYSIAGDWATVEADGKVKLLGRGSICINTGGEKVFPEEVEEAIKTHEAVRDAVCVGVPDERFGQAITGVVELLSGASAEE